MADDDETTPITPSGSRWEPTDHAAEAAPAGDADPVVSADDTTSGSTVDPTAAAAASGLDPEPPAKPGLGSRLAARRPGGRTVALGAGALALVLLGGAGGFALGHAGGHGEHGDRPGWSEQRMSEEGSVPGQPGMPGQGMPGMPEGHGAPPGGMPGAPQGVLPGAPVAPPEGWDEDGDDPDGDGDGSVDQDDDGGSTDGSTDDSAYVQGSSRT